MCSKCPPRDGDATDWWLQQWSNDPLQAWPCVRTLMLRREICPGTATEYRNVQPPILPKLPFCATTSICSSPTYHGRHLTRFLTFRGQPPTWEATNAERFIVARVLLRPVPDWHLMAPGVASHRVDIKWPRSDVGLPRVDTARLAWKKTWRRVGPRSIVSRSGFISRRSDCNEMSDDSVN